MATTALNGEMEGIDSCKKIVDASPSEILLHDHPYASLYAPTLLSAESLFPAVTHNRESGSSPSSNFDEETCNAPNALEETENTIKSERERVEEKKGELARPSSLPDRGPYSIPSPNFDDESSSAPSDAEETENILESVREWEKENGIEPIQLISPLPLHPLRAPLEIYNTSTDLTLGMPGRISHTVGGSEKHLHGCIAERSAEAERELPQPKDLPSSNCNTSTVEHQSKPSPLTSISSTLDQPISITPQRANLASCIIDIDSSRNGGNKESDVTGDGNIISDSSSNSSSSRKRRKTSDRLSLPSSFVRNHVGDNIDSKSRNDSFNSFSDTNTHANTSINGTKGTKNIPFTAYTWWTKGSKNMRELLLPSTTRASVFPTVATENCKQKADSSNSVPFVANNWWRNGSQNMQELLPTSISSPEAISIAGGNRIVESPQHIENPPFCHDAPAVEKSVSKAPQKSDSNTDLSGSMESRENQTPLCGYDHEILNPSEENVSQWSNDDELWMDFYQRLVAYKNLHETSFVPPNDKTYPELANWIQMQIIYYHAETMKTKHQHLLTSIGFDFYEPRKRCDKTWEAMFKRYVAYRKKHDIFKVFRCSRDDPELGNWIRNQRALHKRNVLKEDRKRKLDAFFDWNIRHQDSWDVMFNKLKDFRAQTGHTYLKENKEIDMKLANWCCTQRAKLEKQTLSKKRVQRLESIGFTGSSRRSFKIDLSVTWEEMLDRCKDYSTTHGHMVTSMVASTDPQLASWISKQRAARCNGSLSKEQRKQLEGLGFDFDVQTEIHMPNSIDLQRDSEDDELLF